MDHGSNLPGYPCFRAFSLDDGVCHLVCLEGTLDADQQQASFRLSISDMESSAWQSDFTSDDVASMLAQAGIGLELPTLTVAVAMALDARSEVQFAFDEMEQRLQVKSLVMAPDICSEPMPFQLPPAGAMDKVVGTRARDVLRRAIQLLVGHNSGREAEHRQLQAQSRQASQRLAALDGACRQLHPAIGKLLAERNPELAQLTAAAAAAPHDGTPPSKRRRAGAEVPGPSQAQPFSQQFDWQGSLALSSHSPGQPPARQPSQLQRSLSGHPPIPLAMRSASTHASEALPGAPHHGGGSGRGGGLGAGNIRLKLSEAERGAWDVYRRVERSGLLLHTHEAELGADAEGARERQHTSPATPSDRGRGPGAGLRPGTADGGDPASAEGVRAESASLQLPFGISGSRDAIGGADGAPAADAEGAKGVGMEGAERAGSGAVASMDTDTGVGDGAAAPAAPLPPTASLPPAAPLQPYQQVDRKVVPVGPRYSGRGRGRARKW